jgi:hypothetical protein
VFGAMGSECNRQRCNVKKDGYFKKQPQKQRSETGLIGDYCR